jgi:hypothetical protein
MAKREHGRDIYFFLEVAPCRPNSADSRTLHGSNFGRKAIKELNQSGQVIVWLEIRGRHGETLRIQGLGALKPTHAVLWRDRRSCLLDRLSTAPSESAW